MATSKKTTTSRTTTTKKVTQPIKAEAEVVVNEVATNIEETKETSEERSPIVSYKAKKAIPMDALVMVRSNVNGKLVYVSKKTNGYKEIWSSLGEEIPMEMAELYSMKNSNRSFFTENWIEVDPIVLRDLQMEHYYKDAISIEDLDSIFELQGEELERKIDSMKENIRNAFVLDAIKRIEEGTLTNIRTISTIEKKLNCELYERN